MLPAICFCVFQEGILQRVFPIEESYVISFLPIQATYPTHLISLYFAVIKQQVVCMNDTVPGHV